MKKLILLLFISISVANLSYSQLSYGFSLGGNISSLKGDAVKSLNNAFDLTNGYVDQHSNTGISARVFADIPLSEKFSFEPGLSFNQRGYSIRGDLSSSFLKFLNTNISLSANSNYLGLDGLAKYKPAEGFSIKVGPQVSLLTNSIVKFKTTVLGFSLVNEEIEISNSLSKIDAGITGALAYEFTNGVSVSGFYTHGLSPVDKNSDFKAYNRTAGITLGFSF